MAFLMSFMTFEYLVMTRIRHFRCMFPRWLLFNCLLEPYRLADILGRIYFGEPRKSDIVIINAHDP